MIAFIENILILILVSTIIPCLLGIRPRVRSVAPLALAGLVGVVLFLLALFEPIQQAAFPFRYQQVGESSLGESMWNPADAPEWLLETTRFGRLPRTAAVYAEVSYPSPIPGVVYHDPSAPSACGVLGAGPGDAAEPPAAQDRAGMRAYRGVQVLALYLSSPNTIAMAAALLVPFGLLCVAMFHVVRWVHPSASVRAAFRGQRRGGVVVLAAWCSTPWPALALFSHAFWVDLWLASGSDATLALGGIGAGAISGGAVLGCALTISAVVLSAHRRAPAATPCGNACGHPLETPLSRCPECGTGPGAGAPRRGGVVRRRAVWCSLWLAVVFLLCAPLSFPLVGRLLPESMLPAESLGKPVLNP